MAIVTINVPDEIWDAFEETFRERNKSALIAALMRDAVERHHHHGVHGAALDAMRMMRVTPAFHEDDAMPHIDQGVSG
jgi:hypothetical protein